MKVQAKSTIKVLYNDEIVTIFEKGKTYSARKREDFGYSVTNELKENNLFCDEAFSSNFKIIE